MSTEPHGFWHYLAKWVNAQPTKANGDTWTRAELARAIDVKASTVTRWLNYESQYARADRVPVIARFFGVPQRQVYREALDLWDKHSKP